MFADFNEQRKGRAGKARDTVDSPEGMMSATVRQPIPVLVDDCQKQSVVCLRASV